jgi:hypothetical protein
MLRRRRRNAEHTAHGSRDDAFRKGQAMREQLLAGKPPTGGPPKPGFELVEVPCDLCPPDPAKPFEPSGLCLACRGAGDSLIPANIYEAASGPCQTCGGTGRCFRCEGTGKIRIQRPRPAERSGPPSTAPPPAQPQPQRRPSAEPLRHADVATSPGPAQAVPKRNQRPRAPAPSPAGIRAAAQLRQLVELHSSGAITDEQFRTFAARVGHEQ